MQCKQCKAKWEIDQRTSALLVSCPFCGASLADDDDGEPKIFDNSKAALIYIAKKHGSAVLLSKQLKSFFPDYAPQVSKNIKRLVFAVYENDAASILQNNLNSSQADKEIAFKQAVAKLTEAFITQDAAEGIIREFTTALGWQLSVPMQAQQQPQPQQTPKSVPPTDTNIVAKLVQGKTRNLRFGKYQWRALDVQSDKALLLAKDIVEKRSYNDQHTDITWENCTLRHYLNNEFYNKFSSQEQTMILTTRNTNANNQRSGTKGGRDTTDKIFLLSIEEVVRYFGDSGRLKNRLPKDEFWINDEFNKKRIANYEGKAEAWWLRSSGYSGHSAMGVGIEGSLITIGDKVHLDGVGVRPALWLNLKS
jgi:hypothetical protein